MTARKRSMSIRLPESIHHWIAEQADRNGRSISGEVAYRMKRMMEQDEARQNA